MPAVKPAKPKPPSDYAVRTCHKVTRIRASDGDTVWVRATSDLERALGWMQEAERAGDSARLVQIHPTSQQYANYRNAVLQYTTDLAAWKAARKAKKGGKK